jgi:hypothetical protein
VRRAGRTEHRAAALAVAHLDAAAVRLDEALDDVQPEAGAALAVAAPEAHEDAG